MIIIIAILVIMIVAITMVIIIILTSFLKSKSCQACTLYLTKDRPEDQVVKLVWHYFALLPLYHGLLVLLSIYHHHHHLHHRHHHHRYLQVSLITCMMSAESPDTAGPDCWLQMELDYSLVEVNSPLMMMTTCW